MPLNMYDLVTTNGKANIWGWLICIGTILLIFVSIYQLVLSIRKLHKDDAQDIRLREIELNMQKLMGGTYQRLSK